MQDSPEFKTNRASYGKLITPDIKLKRKYFEEFLNLYGVSVYYIPPKTDLKRYTVNGELKSVPDDIISTKCIFEDHPTAKTLKKLGWSTELLEDEVLISVKYDLPNLQKGAFFLIPSPYDNTKARLFKVDIISSIMIYPASLTCKLVPEYLNEFDEQQHNHQDNTLNLIVEEDSNKWL